MKVFQLSSMTRQNKTIFILLFFPVVHRTLHYSSHFFFVFLILRIIFIGHNHNFPIQVGYGEQTERNGDASRKILCLPIKIQYAKVYYKKLDGVGLVYNRPPTD